MKLQMEAPSPSPSSESGRHRLAATAAAVLAAVITAGCAVATSATPQDSETPTRKTLSSEEFTAVQGRLEELMPAMQNEAAPFFEDLTLDTLREESCLRPEIEEQQTQTRWRGQLSGFPAGPQTANDALDALRVLLAADGWALTSEESIPEEVNGMARELYFQKDGLSVTARYERGELVPDTIGIMAATACVDHPEDHRMLRSPLDPGYGNSSQFYPDGA